MNNTIEDTNTIIDAQHAISIYEDGDSPVGVADQLLLHSHNLAMHNAMFTDVCIEKHYIVFSVCFELCICLLILLLMHSFTYLYM